MSHLDNHLFTQNLLMLIILILGNSIHMHVACHRQATVLKYSV